MKPFNINKITGFIISEINKFSEAHKKETFYAFAIDAHYLCLNSTEEFEKTLKYYQEKFDDFENEEEISILKMNPGDWTYQGFTELNDKNGFHLDSYLEYYLFNEGEDHQNDWSYHKAVDKLIEILKTSKAFDHLKKVDDFKVFWIKKINDPDTYNEINEEDKDFEYLI